METTRCPECGQPAEVVDRTVLASTDGPVEHAHVCCVQRHHFVLPVEYLTRDPRRAGERVEGQARTVAEPTPVRVRTGS